MNRRGFLALLGAAGTARALKAFPRLAPAKTPRRVTARALEFTVFDTRTNTLYAWNSDQTPGWFAVSFAPVEADR